MGRIWNIMRSPVTTIIAPQSATAMKNIFWPGLYLPISGGLSTCQR